MHHRTEVMRNGTRHHPPRNEKAAVDLTAAFSMLMEFSILGCLTRFNR